jgi:formate dehydrogenase iron-sulfur subunit
MKLGGYRALETALASIPEEIIRAVETSSLRGRGGAAFPTGRKWRAVFKQPVGAKFVIANADEGDAGAYIDRFLMEDDPFALIEGMTIAARAVGASKGWIYIRAEYPRAEASLKSAITEACRAGLLGERILGRDFKFDIEVYIGHGSYVCGEETSLLNSIEGRRPEVRARPPYPTEQGLWGQPTLVNNVETFVSVPWIITCSGEAYRALGFSESSGTKAVSLNSLFNRPGLYEVEFGVSVRHIVEELGGGLRTGKLKGVIIGGPLAGIIPPHLLDTPFGFEELHAIGASVGHGGVVAFDEHTSIAALMHHVFSFGAYESCGKCTPCRLGSRYLEQVFAETVRNGAANYWEEKDCERVVSALKLSSLCGFGTGLAEFSESALRHYGKELELCWR